MSLATQDSQFVPITMSDVGLPGFTMNAVNGTDLVAATASNSGWWGFETPLPAVFMRCTQTWPGLILDIGANSGFYSLLGLAAHGANRSIAFEPDPKVLKILHSNKEINDLDGRMRIENLALSDKNGVTTLYIPQEGHGLLESSSSLQQTFKAEHSAEIEVRIARLDDFLTADEQVQVVKIDVEGHERSAVVGAEATLERCRPIVAIELLPDADFDYFDALRQRLRFESLALRAQEVIIEKEIAFDQQAWNHLLVPSEKLQTCLELLIELGLPVTDQR